MELTSKMPSVLPAKNFTYRTEMYLQQREEQEQRVHNSPSTTITTWKNLKYQKRIFEDDQNEIDRVVSVIDSIHSTFNRSLLTLKKEIYSSLYGDDHLSTHLMKTFCQRQDYYSNCNLSMKDHDDDDDRNTQNLSNLFGNFLQTDSDSISNDEDEEENEREKKNSYDSAYGSVRPSRQLSRELLLNMN